MHVKFPHVLWQSVRGMGVLPFSPRDFETRVLLRLDKDICRMHVRLSFFQEPEKPHLSCTIQSQPGPSTAWKEIAWSPKDFRAELSRTLRCFRGPKWGLLCGFKVHMSGGWIFVVRWTGIWPRPQLLASYTSVTYLIFVPEPAFPSLHKDPPQPCVLVILSEETLQAIPFFLTWAGANSCWLISSPGQKIN